jgi:hypothetical protein
MFPYGNKIESQTRIGIFHVQAGTASIRLVRETKEETRSRGLGWRYHADVSGSAGTKPAVVVGDVTRYPTKSEAWKAAEGIRLAVGNPVQPDLVTFGGLINCFLREALPERKGTADCYRSWVLNHINPRWEAVPL